MLVGFENVLSVLDRNHSHFAMPILSFKYCFIIQCFPQSSKSHSTSYKMKILRGNPIPPSRTVGRDEEAQEELIGLNKQTDEIHLKIVSNVRKGKTPRLPLVLYLAHELNKRPNKGERQKESDLTLRVVLFKKSNKDYLPSLPKW